MRKKLKLIIINNIVVLSFIILFFCFMFSKNVYATENYTTITLTKEDSLTLQQDKYYIKKNGNEEDIEREYNNTQIELTGETENEIKIDADCEIKINNLKVESKNGAGIRVKSGKKLTLNLNGNNSIKGAGSYAGICVEKDAQLTVNGTGELEVIGGCGNKNNSTYYTAGAGIGGDGINNIPVSSGNGKEEVSRANHEIGTIIIQSGNITAIGGENIYDYGGAGAGIGSGGLYFDKTGENIPASGNIEICGGTVSAIGGNANKSNGGAGIGAGSHNMGMGLEGVYNTNNITIKIKNGSITATGGQYAAGIGGGGNIESGKIYISGGNVNAKGNSGKQYSIGGGAGIGGGDNAPLNSIEISEKATVIAEGGRWCCWNR